MIRFPIQPAGRHLILLSALVLAGLACSDEAEDKGGPSAADAGTQDDDGAVISDDVPVSSDTAIGDAGNGGADAGQQKDGDAGAAADGTLCDPCVATSSCTTPANAGARCADHGAAGAFCADACAGDEDCPTGYACKDGKAVEGDTSKLCLPKGAADGACECSASAIAATLWTHCWIAGGEGGKCLGKRVCASGGLGACDAAPAGDEVCNGGDDDCDGQTDEAGCDDGDPCTNDACVDGKCTTTPTAGACDDGDACTEGEACTGGKCAGGSAKVCDDSDACTDDSCAPATGCVFAANTGACDDGDACTTGEVCAAGKCAGGAAKNCDDGIVCTNDSCDTTTGVCVTEISLGPCDDGDACTTDSACGPGSDGKAVCAGSQFQNCDDFNPCTVDTCSPQLGCAATADTKIEVECYSGDPATKDVGLCKAGVKACQADGSLGACTGEKLPELKEACNGLDDDCNGKTDEGCQAVTTTVVGRLASTVIAGKGDTVSLRLMVGGSTVAGPATSAGGGNHLVTGFYGWLADLPKAP